MAGVLETRSLSDESRLIERQLDVTRRQVRLVELGAVLVAWLVGVIMYLLTVVVIDHWLVPLGVVGRVLALAIFFGASAAYFVVAVWPLIMRQINPVYAARAIEESAPSLKNSLINFLLLKKDHRGVKEAVLSAVERRAAADISAVPVDMAVDRSKLIRLGYVLVAAMSLFALYKIRSPKDPFQTVARVLAPWASIDRPARVSVSDVTPGDTRVYYGRVVPITCKVTGLRKEDQVRLLYSTTDGQAVDREVVMTATPGGLLFEGKLPPDGLPGPSGVQQDLIYRVAAGDAETKSFKITVVPAPTIVVDKLQYDFKRYTKRDRQTVNGQGDVHAIEGTKVTVFAQANQPIKTATLEFDPPEDGRPAPETLPMSVEKDRASATFTLQLKPDRAAPWRTTYRIRFLNEHEEKNEAPIVHHIQVTPDLGPEIQWISPNRPRIEVPEDGKTTLELRAIDPDFGLSAIKLVGEVGDKQPLNVSLLKQAAESQQVQYEFRPAEHKLEAGDEITVWGVAEDNRVSPLKDLPEPNTARTSNVVIRIVAGAKPPPGAQKIPNDDQNKKHPGENDPNPKPKPGEEKKPMPGDQGDKNKKQDGEGGKSEEGGDEGSKNQGSQAGKQGDEGGKEGNEGNQGGKSSQDGEGGKSGSNQSQGGGGKENGAKSKEGGSEGGKAEGQTEPGAGGKSAESGKPSGQGAKEQGGADSPMGNSGGKGGEKNEGGKGGEQDPNSETQDNEGGSEAKGREGGAGKSSTPHDGEVIEKVLENLKKNAKNGTEGKKIDERPKEGDANGGENSKEQGNKPPQNKEAPSGNQGKPQQGKPEGQAGAEGQSEEGKEPGGNQSSGQNAKRADDPTKPGFRPAEQKPEGAGNQSGQPESGQGASGKPMAPAGGKVDQPNTEGNQEHVEGQPPSAPMGEGRKPPLDNKKQGDGEQQQPAPGEGGAPQKNPNKTEKGPKAGESGGKDNEQKQPGAGDTGDSGAGQKSDKESGNGPADGANKNKQKSPKGPEGGTEKGEAAPPTQDKKQSDSQGDGSGQNSGGGKEGSGQPSKQAGNDSPGSKSAADQGAGKANESGKGETGEKGGDKEKAAGKTGRSSQNEAGKGSESGKSEDGSEEGQSAGPGTQPKKPPMGSAAGKSPGGKQEGPTIGGGEASEGPPGNNPAGNQNVPDSEAANLEYTRKATNLVLDHLRDQQHDPDPELLKQLNMTKDEMQQFVRRWEAMQKSAQADPNAKQELDESLKSLGLRPPKDRSRKGTTTSDDQRGLQDSGNRTAPPSRYKDQFDAFRKGVGRETK